MNRILTLAISGLFLTGCAGLQPIKPLAGVTMGDNVCGREAMQIYFANQDDTLSITAAQVVSELTNKLARCPKRKVILAAVSGNDGAPATALVAANRIKIVGDILISQGLDAARIIAATDGPLVNSLPRGPIGGVVVMTRQ